MGVFLAIWFLMVGHWVADFMCQRSVWGLTKSSSNLALSKHVGTYTAVFFVFCIPVMGLDDAWWFALVNGGLHWIIDWCTSRVTKKMFALDRMHTFWVVIGFDQLLHYTVMLFTLQQALAF